MIPGFTLSFNRVAGWTEASLYLEIQNDFLWNIQRQKCKDLKSENETNKPIYKSIYLLAYLLYPLTWFLICVYLFKIREYLDHGCITEHIPVQIGPCLLDLRSTEPK